MVFLAHSTTNPLANPNPMTICDHCGFDQFRDVHTGDYTVRRECSRCSRFMGWQKWRDLDLTDDPREQARLARIKKLLAGKLGHKMKRASEWHFNYQTATALATAKSTP